MTEKSSMSVPPAPSKSIRFNPPPNWPAPPPGWTPPQGWAPHPSWPPPPAGWQLWIADPGAASAISGAGMGAGARSSRRVPRWVILAGAVVVGLVIANVTHGIFGHLIALLVWAGAAWSCVRPARARTASTARTWARIGVAACACLAVGAASLAIVGSVTSSSESSGNGKACAAFWAWNNSTGDNSSVLGAYHWATTQPLISDLDQLSEDILASEANGTSSSAGAALADADNVQADCDAAGFPRP